MRHPLTRCRVRDSVGGVDIFDPAFLDNPYPMYRMLRDHAPVHRVPGTAFYLVSSWQLVTDAAARTEDFSSHLTGVMVHQPDGTPSTFDMDGGGQAVHVLATADDPGHAEHRKLVLPVLTKRVRALGDTIDALVDRLWIEEHADGRIDWATGMADRLPLALVAEIIGLPAADVPELLSWAYDSTELLGGVVSEQRLPYLVTSAAQLGGYLHAKFEAAKAYPCALDPAQTVLGALAQTCRAGELADEVAVLILVQLVGAGGESTAGLIANAARILATRPELQNLLREEPTLIGRFLDEVLRLESPFRGHHRHVTRTTTLGGVDLPSGSHLLLLWGSANRDPAVFADPDAVDIDRPNGRTHLAFGKGAHYCIGSALARLEANAAISALLQRSRRFTLVDDAPPCWVPSLFVRRHQSLPLQLL